MAPPKKRVPPGTVPERPAPSRASAKPLAVSDPVQPRPNGVHPPATVDRAQQRIAWEPIGWLVVLAVALGSRLINLDGNPLQPNEAALAMDSWRILHLSQTSQDFGRSFVVGPAPLLVYANVLLFFLLGSTDAVARALPMLVGTLMVASPLLLRRRLGRLGALATGALLATSSTLIFASRSVDPAILASGLGLFLVVALARYLEVPRVSWLMAGGVFAALLVISGPAAYPVVVAFGGLVLVYAAERSTRHLRVQPGSLGFFAQAAPVFPVSPVLDALDRRDLRASLLAAGITLGAVSTGLATHLPGFGESLSGPLTIWAQALGQFDLGSLWLFPMILVSYEPLILAAGIVGAVLALRTGKFFEAALVWWAAASVLVVLLSGADNPLWIATVIPPLAFLGGAALDRLPELLATRQRRRLLVPFGAVVGVFGVTMLIALGNTSLPDPAVPRFVALAPPLAILAFVLYFAATYGLPTTGAMAATVGTVALLYLQLHAALLLSPGRALNPGELFLDTATSPDVRTLASQVSLIQDELTIDQQNAGLPVTTDVQILAPYADPLAWYLRRLPDTTVVTSATGSPAIVVLDEKGKPPAGGYAGQVFQFSTSAPRPTPTYVGVVHWWLYHQTPDATATNVKVFVKAQVNQQP